MKEQKLYMIVGAIVIGIIALYFYSQGGGNHKAQGEVEQKLYPIHDDATFEAETRTFSTLPFAKADLDFSLMIPKDWEEEMIVDKAATEMTPKIVNDIVVFESPMIGTSRATVVVQVLKLEHEISAKNWLRNYILASGYAPEGEVAEITPVNAAGTFVSTQDGRSTYTRIGVVINAGTAIIVRFDVPLHLKEYTAYIRDKIVSTLKVTYPKEDPVETQKPVTLVDSIKFYYPISWMSVTPDFRDMNRLSLQLHNKGTTGLVEGYIRFLAVRRTRSSVLMTEAESVRKYVQETLHMDVLNLVSSDVSGAYDRFPFNRYEVYDVQRTDKSQNVQQLHFVALGDKEWYIFAILVTPAEHENLYTWARNIRTFDLIIRSIK
jgi:hypothetical protein